MAILIVFIGFLAALTPGAGGQDEFISYTLDGKSVRLAEVKLVWHPENYLDVEGARRERVDCGPNAYPRIREAEAGITFQISPEGEDFVGTHAGRSSDVLPVYVSWYGLVKRGSSVEIADGSADLDGNGEGQSFTVTFDNFGPEGTLVVGTFFGRLYDGNGKAHTVENGRFAVRRHNA
jgi:hypothetical protein